LRPPASTGSVSRSSSRRLRNLRQFTVCPCDLSRFTVVCLHPLHPSILTHHSRRSQRGVRSGADWSQRASPLATCMSCVQQGGLSYIGPQVLHEGGLSLSPPVSLSPLSPAPSGLCYCFVVSTPPASTFLLLPRLAHHLSQGACAVWRMHCCSVRSHRVRHRSPPPLSGTHTGLFAVHRGVCGRPCSSPPPPAEAACRSIACLRSPSRSPLASLHTHSCPVQLGDLKMLHR
jgi:hypothetical protein